MPRPWRPSLSLLNSGIPPHSSEDIEDVLGSAEDSITETWRTRPEQEQQEHQDLSSVFTHLSACYPFYNHPSMSMAAPIHCLQWWLFFLVWSIDWSNVSQIMVKCVFLSICFSRTMMVQILPVIAQTDRQKIHLTAIGKQCNYLKKNISTQDSRLSQDQYGANGWMIPDHTIHATNKVESQVILGSHLCCCWLCSCWFRKAWNIAGGKQETFCYAAPITAGLEEYSCPY